LKATTIIQSEQGLATSSALAIFVDSLIHQESQALHLAFVNNVEFELLRGFSFNFLLYLFWILKHFYKCWKEHTNTQLNPKNQAWHSRRRKLLGRASKAVWQMERSQWMNGTTTN